MSEENISASSAECRVSNVAPLATRHSSLVTLSINGQPMSVPSGTIVAAAIAAGHAKFRRSVSGEPRGPLCGMGVCMECQVTIDGQPHNRSCQLLCREGMAIRTSEVASIGGQGTSDATGHPHDDALGVSLSPRGKSGERAGERGRDVLQPSTYEAPLPTPSSRGERTSPSHVAGSIELHPVATLSTLDTRHSEFFESEVVVVGAGPAGLAAACTAAESGAEVAVIDETPWLGGQIWRGCDGANLRSTPRGAQRWIERFRNCGAMVLDRTSVIASPRPGLLLAEREGRPCQIHWKRLILATGARELFLPFPGWTLPGATGPGGLQSLVKNGWPIAGQRVVLAGSGPLLLAVAEGLKKHGAGVVCIAEQAPSSNVLRFGLGLAARPAKFWQAALFKLRLAGVPYRCGVWPVRAQGPEHVRSVILTDGKRTWTEDCDVLACAFGLVPNLELPLALGCKTTNDGFVWVDAEQSTSVPDVYCVGEPTGIGGADCALVEGQIAGYAIARNRVRAEALFSQRASWHRFRRTLATAFALRPELKSLAADDTIVCRCEDVTLGRMRQFGGWREAKLQTRCGMGACQGRVCGAAARVLLGWSCESVRPPILPARVGSLISQTEQAA